MAKTKKEWTKTHSVIAVILAVAVLAAILFLILWLLPEADAPQVVTGNPQIAVDHPIAIDPTLQNMGQAQSPETAKTSPIEGFTDRELLAPTVLDNGLSIVRSGSYTGLFVEDGSNAPCTDVLAILVTNTTDSFLELAEIAIPVGEKTAYFKLYSLPAGQSLLVQEKTAMTYDPQAAFGKPVLLSSSMPQKEFSLHPETFSIMAADHVINLTNRSSSDITGNLAVYYKNVQNGIYLGGITYRRTRESGVTAGAVAQFICENYTVAGSEILYIIYEQ